MPDSEGMDKVSASEIARGDFRWAFHLLGYLAAYESAPVRIALTEALESTGSNYPIPAVAVELLAELLEKDLSDETPF
jgi:hypothetical protein